ncbi:S-adenosyl-l-methionine hydroxide adenosyltransferase family protein [Halomicroarcula sp. GCM10025324]|uniref:SAM hydrolase/SAM-dependent halogenase family protein n=1 Tax=Haloarcula TaxID=2237 RepID=UPI0023E8837D|nr:SAM-dependent chlorinase/fluorinase [Halomicroarcula sp. ZS-22-S1]
MITLSSDFGAPYPAAMKGVIARACDARLVDVSHEFPRQDVSTAAFWLTQTLPYFPPAVHCVVVDPGVGTDRDALVVRAGEHALVGPDNGVLLPAARELAGDVEVFTWAYEDAASTTFHGRDVFAPAAAAVHETGVDAVPDLDRTTATDEFVDLQFPVADRDGDGATGEVLVVDGFGNVITNVPGDVLAGRFGESVTVNGDAVPARRAYAAVEVGERLVTVGSHGNVELAVNQGRGDDAFSLEVGDAVGVAR